MKKEIITAYEANINFRERQKELKRNRRELFATDEEWPKVKAFLVTLRKRRIRGAL